MEPSDVAPGTAPPYATLTPDAVLNALDAVGLVTTGSLLTLNSYENRVFQVGIDDDDGRPGFVVAKFYRPGRWTDAQILEEHAFTRQLADAEVQVVPPREINGRTLHEIGGFRFSVFPRRGGRAPNLDDPEVLQWIGRYLGRLHAIGREQPYAARPALDVETFGAEPREYLLAHDWVPLDVRAAYTSVSAQAIDAVRQVFERVETARTLRLHGDVHEGNILWYDGLKESGPHFVDFDDSRMGPAVQDLWMLLGHDADEKKARLDSLLAGYEEFAEFDWRELRLIEALRTLRLLHYSAWIARRWQDPAFPAAFPWFDTPRYWEERVLELREQVAAMTEGDY